VFQTIVSSWNTRSANNLKAFEFSDFGILTHYLYTLRNKAVYFLWSVQWHLSHPHVFLADVGAPIPPLDTIHFSPIAVSGVGYKPLVPTLISTPLFHSPVYFPLSRTLSFKALPSLCHCTLPLSQLVSLQERWWYDREMASKGIPGDAKCVTAILGGQK